MPASNVTLYAIYKKTITATVYSGSNNSNYQNISSIIYNNTTSDSIEAKLIIGSEEHVSVYYESGIDREPPTISDKKIYKHEENNMISYYWNVALDNYTEAIKLKYYVIITILKLIIV